MTYNIKLIAALIAIVASGVSFASRHKPEPVSR